MALSLSATALLPGRLDESLSRRAAFSRPFAFLIL
jgi:hypothetical protein